MLQAIKELLADALWPLAEVLGATLPDFVRVPSLGFVLPHVMYWCALMALPFLAMTIVWWEKSRASAREIPRWVKVVLHLGTAVALGPFWGSVLVYGMGPIQNPLDTPLSQTFAPQVWLLGFVVGVVIAQGVLWLMRRGLVRRADGRREPRVTPGIAYLLWVGGGFIGLHRLYLRAGRLAIVYMILFALLLLGNERAEIAREAQSEARDDRVAAEFDAEHFRGLVEQGREGMQARLDDAERRLAEAEKIFQRASAAREAWAALSGLLGWLIALMLLIDAALIPRMVRRCNVLEEGEPPPGEVQVMGREPTPSVRQQIQTPFTRGIGTVNGWVGEFIAYWAVLAVAVYYYEVVARYVFNSPTNWAHEGMFLMFGMQYLLSGGYALRENAHVRVDVVYERFSEHSRAIMDLFTSVVFFIFTATLFITGTTFALDALAVWEVSFNEWAIQYWPVKLTLGVGALLIVLQGIAGLVQDVVYLHRIGGPATRAALRWIGLIGAPGLALLILWLGLPYVLPYDWLAGIPPLMAGAPPEPLTGLLFGEGGNLREWFWALLWLVLIVVFVWLAVQALRRLPGMRGA